SPVAVGLSLPAGEHGEVDLSVTNEGAVLVDLFGVPLPEEGMPEEPPGTLLFHTDPYTVNAPYDLAMTMKGRIFAADNSGHRTWEYTPELERFPFFEHPHTDNTSRATGLARMPPEHAPPGHGAGTLWWMDVDTDCAGPHCTVVSTLLIEGNLAGSPTGRSVDLYDALGPGNTDSPLYYTRGVPNYLSYDAEAASGTGLFYYVDAVNEDIWAINVEGNVPEGYPVPQTDYDPGGPNTILQAGLDATRASDSGAYLEGSLGLQSTGEYTGVVVTERWGQNTGVETPLDLL